MFNLRAILLFAVVIFFSLLSLTSFVSAQQYAGHVIKNSLPAVDGSEVAYFRIANGHGQFGTVTNYHSLNSTGGRVVPSEVKRAVIFLHGLQRDPYTYIAYMLKALAAVPSDAGVSADNVAILCPYFPNGEDKNVGYPWTNGLPSGRGSTSSAFVWQSAGWASGDNTQYPALIKEVSSYDVLDQMVQYFDNKKLFPNMNQIVVGGHSLGAQMVQRYAAVGSVLDTKAPVSYYVANPDSLVWFSKSRPLPTDNCSTYDNWREGFSAYTNRYGNEIVSQGREAVLARYTSRQIAYARGTRDWGDDSFTCAAFTQGANRGERFFNFINTFTPTCTSGFGNCATIDYVSASHEAEVMMTSTSGQARLFLDNFNGAKDIAYDFGYPRLQPLDDPLPNPEMVSPASDVVNGMTFSGCWTDNDTVHSLAYVAYTGNTNSTIEECTSVCSASGFQIAGALFAKDCYCDDAIGYNSLEQAKGSCGSFCAGNPSEYCGAYSRFSIYAFPPLHQKAPQTQPSKVGDYTFLQCQVDDVNARALTGASEVQGNLTLEGCAGFCGGIGATYFGVEYGNECYCGTKLASTSSIGDSATCDIPCAGKSTETCGGSFRLSVYSTAL